MCLQHPCYESLNRFVATKPARIIWGILLVIIVAFGCVRLLQASNDLHASKNAKIAIIPEEKDNLIHFNAKVQEDVEKLTSKIDQVYEVYKRGNENLQRCNYDSPSTGKSCAVEWDDFGPCKKENDYGYSRGKPCVFLKFRKIRDWMPKFTNASDLPDDFPQAFKHMVTENRGIFVTCQGVNPADIENIGPLSFFPSPSYPSYYFPWNGQDDYLEPIIAVYFENPKYGILISVKCTLWTQDQRESVEFILFVD